MDFKFDFLVDQENTQQSTPSSEGLTSKNEGMPAKKIEFNKQTRAGGIETVIIINEKLKKYRNPIDSKSQNEVVDIARSSDLKSGIYEGGFKLWECALDLIEFLLKQGVDKLEGKRILEVTNF